MKTILLLTAMGAAVITVPQAPAQPVQLVNAFPALTFTRPILLTHAGDGTNRVFVAQQNGIIRVFPNDSAVTTASTFLNITARLSATSGEEGLLGLAFHPDYEVNGYFYVNYTAPSPLRTVIARYSVLPGNPNKADSLSEQVILEFTQPYSNHNGGMVLFGTDGLLYVSTGDGGSGGDPQNNAQNPGNLLGKILRIDIDTTNGTTLYGIPPGNPFAGGGGRGEIFVWGLRNPWRFSQDPVTGQIWVGDVGQGTWEEIDLIEGGRNYGWRCYEGNSPYNLSGCGSASTYTFPLKQYSSASPNPECSAVGGYVYRGARRPDLTGAYIYGDYCSGKIWKFRYDGVGISEDTLLIDSPFSISSFGTDELGELYICNLGGTIHRFAGPPVPAPPALLSPPDNAHTVPVPATLLWRTSAGATVYRAELATNPAFTAPVFDDSTLTDTTVIVGELGAGTEYFWRVRARNTVGWSAPSPVRRFVTMPLPPAAPVLLAPPDSVTFLRLPFRFVWSRTAGAVTYRVHIGDSLFSNYLEIPSVSDTSVEFNALINGGTTLFWRVRAENPGGASAWTSVWRFTTYPDATVEVPLNPGWSLVSVPVVVQDLSAPEVFPGFTAGPFGFAGPPGYQLRDTLAYGEGYWVKFDSSRTITITGPVRFTDSVSVRQGWNLIGPLSLPLPAGVVATIPPGILDSPFFAYSGSYVAADTLRPARGYWVKASAEGWLVMQAQSPGAPAARATAGQPPSEALKP